MPGVQERVRLRHLPSQALRLPEANRHGKTKKEARQSLTDTIALILEDRREDALRGVPDDEERETVTHE